MGKTKVQLHAEREANPDAKRPKVVNRDMQKLVKFAWDAGAHCVSGGKNHVKIFPADGSKMIPIPSTPSKPSSTYRNKLTRRSNAQESVFARCSTVSRRSRSLISCAQHSASRPLRRALSSNAPLR